jgi:phosphohistidine phosphatase
MKTLLLLRHAKSSWKDAGIRDHDRPLNGRGRRDAPRIGRLLAEHGLVPDLIISSTARRARKTAEKVAEASGYVGALDAAAALYLAAPPAITQVIRLLPDEAGRVLLVGHNPGLEELLAALIGQYERLPTAALAHVELEFDRWQDFAPPVAARLARLWRPKEFPADDAADEEDSDIE